MRCQTQGSLTRMAAEPKMMPRKRDSAEPKNMPRKRTAGEADLEDGYGTGQLMAMASSVDGYGKGQGNGEAYLEQYALLMAMATSVDKDEYAQAFKKMFPAYVPGNHIPRTPED